MFSFATTPDLSKVSDDELEMSMVAWEAVIAQARVNQSRLLREADRRQLHTRDGARSMSEWTAARLDVAPENARILVRTGRRLETANDIETALDEGELTFDRAVELARARAEGVLLADQARWDLPALRRRIAHGLRQTRVDERTAFAGRYLALQPSIDNTRMRLHGLLPAAEGNIVAEAIDRRADEIVPAGTEVPVGARRADALVSLCTDTRARGQAEPLIHVFVDGDGASVGGRFPVGPELIERVLCTGSVEVADVTSRAKPLGVGRRTRVVPRKLRRAVLHRDLGSCVMDGCTSTYRLEAHHVIPWSEGGPTEADNLATLCWFHHHVAVHGQGRRLDPDSPPHRRRFLREEHRLPP